ncbi:uncharacterized protein LOC101582906 [Octodon degus]|uniref:Uncharacterized protein LOC101582906 n=1 Tax=Octodon degus TaxID=10160 RepID=A0A6P6DB16_OCTDE|nr:uncharacterized protein LOC101582906 [Octodon degus]
MTLKTLQRKLLREETSLQETKTELARFKEQHSFQITSLRDEVRGLQELITSLAKIKALKNSSIQSLERGNWNLTKRVTELENLLRVHLADREKAQRRADFLVNRLPHKSRFPPANLKGQEDSLDIFRAKDKDKAFLARDFESDIIYTEGPNDAQKIWDKSLQVLSQEDNQTPKLGGLPCACSQEIKTAGSQHQDLLSQLATLLSDSGGPIPAAEGAVKERIQDIGANEQAWKSLNSGPCLLISAKDNSIVWNSLTDKHKFKQLDTLLNIQRDFQIATTLRLEDKIQKLQKQLSDLKLSNKTMKTQLSRVNILKLTDFRDTIMKMLGFNMKTADKEIINQLKLIIQVYEIANGSKIASACEKEKDNE